MKNRQNTIFLISRENC